MKIHILQLFAPHFSLKHYTEFSLITAEYTSALWAMFFTPSLAIAKTEKDYI